MKTGTIILGLITLGFIYLAMVFGIDTALSLESHATISEWVYNWIQNPTNFNRFNGIFICTFAGLGYLYYHIVSFKPKK